MSEHKGITKEEMNKDELRELALSLGIDTEEAIKEMKKSDLLGAIGAWEEKAIAEREAGESGTLTAAPESAQDDAPVAPQDNGRGYHEGKKIASITPVELNGKSYNDVTTEDGVTFRIPKENA